jgi:hypothetical protein
LTPPGMVIWARLKSAWFFCIRRMSPVSCREWMRLAEAYLRGVGEPERRRQRRRFGCQTGEFGRATFRAALTGSNVFDIT